MSGAFIVLEGVEGSGKSTQVQLLRDWLEQAGVPCTAAREPGGTRIGEEIRRALLHGGDVPARAELLLMLAARAAFVEQIIRPALERGEVVIADRYELSSIAYQGYGRGLPVDEVRRVNAFATGGLTPDLTIILDVDQQEGAARQARAGLGVDRIERAGASFHRQVAGAYRLLIDSEPGVVAVPGTDDPGTVHGVIRRMLESRFPETFRSAAG
jgi:dTMP kinase